MSDAAPDTPVRRPYHSPLRRQQADATRTRIVQAARSLFSERGWAHTRMRDIAARAGVSEAAVYAAYGSKAGLARALVAVIEAAAGLPTVPEQLAVADPAGQLKALVASDRRLFEDSGDVIALLRDGGRFEPDLLAVYREGRAHGDQLRRATFSAWPAHALRAGVTVEAAIDAYAALCNIDVYRELTDERRWTPARVEAWWIDTLRCALLR